MGHICALLLSGSDIWFLGTTGPEPDSKKQPDIRPSRTGTGHLVHPSVLGPPQHWSGAQSSRSSI